MELLTSKTLWQDFDPTSESLEVTVARVTVNENYTAKKVYFTGRTFEGGNKTRVCANVYLPNKKTDRAVLLICNSDKDTTNEQLQDIVESGFVAMTIDIDGRTATSCGTLYPPEVDFCNAICNKDIFYFGKTVKESKIYEQSLCCMRAVTYLLQEEEINFISVVTIGECSVLGAIVCSQDNRVTNGAFLFGHLHMDYPEQVANQRQNGEGQLVEQLAYEDISQAWTVALAPQNYALSIDIPIYVVNSANSPYVDVIEVNQIYNRLNDQCRMLIVPDMFDCLQNQYLKSVIAWCNGVNVVEDYQINYLEENGEYFVKLNTSTKLKDVAVWYCVNGDHRARHWVSAKIEESEDGYLAKLTLFEANCNVIAFAEIGGKITISTSLLEIPVKNATNLKTINGIVYSGEGDYELIAVGEPKAWLIKGVQAKRKKGYLGIVGAQGNCLATFAMADKIIRKTPSRAISFDVCATHQNQLVVSVVCGFGVTNDIYVARVQLIGDGKWQRVTVDAQDFHSTKDNKLMAEDKLADLLIVKSAESFIINNIILV